MSDRTITVAGNFKQPVDITNSLQNGVNCSASNNSHAEGFESSAHGDYSYAGGYHALASNNFSYVWSGRADQASTFGSNGNGTYSIYVGNDNNPLEQVYINGKTLSSNVADTFDNRYSNDLLKMSYNVWKSSNAFDRGASLSFWGGSYLRGVGNAQLNWGSDTTALFSGTLQASQTLTYNNIGTDAYQNYVMNLTSVKNILQGSLNACRFTRREDNNAVGSSVRPVYVDSSGVVKAIKNNVVVMPDGKSSLGGNDKLVYIKDNQFVESTKNLNLNGRWLIGMKDGELDYNMGGSCGGNNVFTYLKDGQITQSTISAGSTLRGVYFNRGSLVAWPDNFQFGKTNQPIYIKNGSLALCDQYTSGGGSGGITSASLGPDNDVSLGNYVGTIGANGADSNNFIKSLTGYHDSETKRFYIVGKTGRPTITNVEGLDDKLGTLAEKSSLKYYTPKFTVSLNGDGNVISSLSYENDEFTFSKAITTLTDVSVNDSNNVGNVVTGLAKSDVSVKYDKGYVLSSIKFADNVGNVVTNVAYDYNDGNPILSLSKDYVFNDIDKINEDNKPYDPETGDFVKDVSTGSNGKINVKYAKIEIPSVEFKTEPFPLNNATIGSKNCVRLKVNISKEGWSPLGIVGFNVEHGTTTGSYNHNATVMGVYLAGDEANVHIGNASDHTIYTDGGSIIVLYKKG